MLDNLNMMVDCESDEQLLLVEEIQHRVASEYGILVANLNHRAEVSTDPIRTFLSETSERLKAFAAVHRALLLPRNSTTVDLGQYLHELCSALSRASLAERGLSLLFHKASIRLEAHRAWRVGLIVSELITNAVRHGSWERSDGVIEVELLSNLSDIQCLVSDNGGGSNGLLPNRGTLIVRALAQELGGRIHREFNGRGVSVLLIFPCRPTIRAS